MADAPILSWAEVSERLKTMPRGSGFQLSKRLDMNSSYFYRKLSKGGELTERQARIVREFLGAPAADLAALPQLPDRRRVPVYGYAAMGGEDLIAMNEGDVLEFYDLPMGLELGPGEWFAVRGIGSSMEPRIFAGDPLLIRRRWPPVAGKDALIEFTDGSGVIKTYKGQRDGRVFVEQWNEHRLLDYDATKVRAIHGGIIKL